MQKKNIKCKALLPNEEELFLLEKGAKKIIINRAISNKLKYLSGVISEDKNLCNAILTHNKINIPPFLKVAELTANEKEFLHINKPLVIKPFDTNKGVEIHMNINTEEELQIAFDKVKRVSEHAIVQKQATGKDYRILVIDKKVVGVLWNEWPYVIGDGISSIQELVSIENKRRRKNKIEVNGKLLSMLADIDISTVKNTNTNILPLGEKLYVNNCGNGWSGAIPHNVTENVHPSILKNAIKITKILDIDVAGIDIRCKHISKPLKDSNFNVIEVNIRPSLLEHMYPFTGKKIDVLDQYIDYLFKC